MKSRLLHASKAKYAIDVCLRITVTLGTYDGTGAFLLHFSSLCGPDVVFGHIVVAVLVVVVAPAPAVFVPAGLVAAGVAWA